MAKMKSPVQGLNSCLDGRKKQGPEQFKRPAAQHMFAPSFVCASPGKTNQRKRCANNSPRNFKGKF